VFGVYPEREYSAANYDSIGNLIFGVQTARQAAQQVRDTWPDLLPGFQACPRHITPAFSG
ncbi:MAG: hypothetical protein WCH98_05995, partial [Verrucomicrobiota bacterium]